MLQKTTFALKRMQSRSKWKDELNALNRFRGKRSGHPHLIKLLFAYEHKGKGFYMLFPLANGDLDYYWENNSSQAPSLEVVRWLVRQCAGIASALRKIHLQDSFPGQNRGRHGDIKPGNILWFEDAYEPRGRLVIADLTMARFHSINTIDNTSARDRDFSMTYRPPETEFNPRTRASQAYDIWSLGCVFLEFVVWYLVGYSAIHPLEGFLNNRQKYPNFKLARFSDDNGSDDKFFKIINNESGDGRTAEVKKSVLMWARILHASTKCSDAIHEFLDLIMTRMLVIEPRERISIEQVNNNLISISSECSNNEEYCSLGSPWAKSAINIQLSDFTYTSYAEYSVTSSPSSLPYSESDYESSFNSTISLRPLTPSRAENTIDNKPRTNRIQMHIEGMANNLPPHSQCRGQSADQPEGGQHGGAPVSPYPIKPTYVARNINTAECTFRESLERPVHAPSMLPTSYSRGSSDVSSVGRRPLNTTHSTGHSVGDEKYPLGRESLGNFDKNLIPSENDNVFNDIKGSSQPGNIKTYATEASSQRRSAEIFISIRESGELNDKMLGMPRFWGYRGFKQKLRRKARGIRTKIQAQYAFKAYKR